MDCLKLRCVWTVKERDPMTGLFLPKLQVRNIFTNYGLNALASAIQGTYVAPNYLVIDTDSALVTTQANPGAISVVLSKRVDISGDTQLVLSPGLAAQETVTFTSVTGSGPYTYNLSGSVVNTHPVNDPAVRAVRAVDTLSSVVSEAQYDATNAPNQRMQAVSGYNNGSTGEWTIQFYFTGTQAVFKMMTLGLADSVTVGQGNLHNHFVLGYDHTTGNDVEIDGALTIINN